MKNIFRISGVVLLILSIILIHSCKKDKPTPPIITTTAISSITQTTATSGGNVTSDGGAAITASGICWSTTTGPTTALSTKTADGTGTGIFTSSITGLTAGIVYYVKAYATNSAGTSYGNEISFTTTSATTPALTTTAAAAITQTTATSGGNVTSDGGATVTARGVCWSTTTGPTTALSTKTTDGTGTGIFTSSIDALTAGTVYYVRAYATNSAGIAYGNEISFTTNPATLPVLSTTAASSITQTTATIGGNVTSDGGATITARGVCWSTSQNPTLTDTKSTDGNGPGVFTSSITGLSIGMTYYVRAYATNSVGTSYGAQESFTTLGPPTVTTAEITTITQTTATGGGNVTAAGGSTVTARGICWSINQNPTITDSKTLDGTGAGNFTSAITGLTGNTTYSVRAYATNSVSTSYGNQASFKTSPILPTIATTAVSSLTATTCLCGGTITNDGGASVIERGVCWSLTASPTILDSKTSNGIGTGTFVSSITGLTTITTYYVRGYATNSVGTAYGSDVTLTTVGQVPTATTGAATSITTTGAVLNGTVNANYLSTVVTFEWGTSASYGSSVTAAQSQVTGSSSISMSGVITELLPGTTYHFKVKAVNELGTTNGSDMTFTTLGAVPTASTVAATSFVVDGSTLNGTVNANYLSTTVSFEYGLTTGYGQSATATQSPTTGNTTTNVSVSITGLSVGAIYHYRVTATNSLGTTNGSDMTFTTLGAVPTVSTIAITSISTTGATVNGTINANYLSTTVSFEYGLTTGYGQSATATQSPATGNTTTNVSVSITGLSVGAIYHYRVTATNSLGTTNGNDMIFTTAPASINDVDGNTYNVVAIGGQVWMKENLKTTKFNDGTIIPIVSDGSVWAALSTPGYCWYNNDAVLNKTIYGALYNWYTIDATTNGGLNVCPTGWHVSTDDDWTILATFLGGESIAGGKLKEVGTTHWWSPNTGATNSSGFTALPSGFRNPLGGFSGIGCNAKMLTSTEFSATSSWYRDMYCDFNIVDKGKNYGKPCGFSVRCLRDN